MRPGAWRGRGPGPRRAGRAAVGRGLALLLLGLLLTPSAALAEGPGAGAEAEGPTVEALALNCMTCHGEDGVSPGSVPTIYGKRADWLTAQLLEFRSGTRESTIMGRIMKAFTDEDIVNLAEYFAARR